MRKTIAVVAVALVIVGAVAVGIRNRRARQQAALSEYETVAVRRDTIVATINASGTILPKVQIGLNSASGGLLTDLRVEPGQEVTEGQVLARLDDRQALLGVQQAEATLRVNQARLEQTRGGNSAADIAAGEASVASAQAAYDLVAYRPDIGRLPQSAALQRSTIDYERALANYKLQVAAIDDTAFKAAAAQLEQAKAQLDRLERAPTAEELAIAAAQVMQAEAALEQAQLRLEESVLKAPFAGTVLATNATVGELVIAAQPLIVLADVSEFYVDTPIDENDIGSVQIGQDAEIALDAFPDRALPGRVSRIDPLGQVTQGVVSYDVRVLVLSSEVPLRPNMTALVDIVVDRKQSVLLVPNRAVRRESGGQRYVEVLVGREIQRRPVTIGLRSELVTEVVDGVVEGEQVVVSAPRENLLEQFGGPFSFGGGR
jgi:HlyD family secretion protein